MSKQLLGIFLLLLSLRLSAQSLPQAQSIVVTWEDDAKIQLITNPDGSSVAGSPPSESISGGATGRLLNSNVTLGGPTTSFLMNDVRMQSRSWTIRWNSQACNGLVFTDPSQQRQEQEAMSVQLVAEPAFQAFDSSVDWFQSCFGADITKVTYNGVDYDGYVLFGGTFSGAIDTPAPSSSISADVYFGNPGSPPSTAFRLGRAHITGTLRIELSDYSDTVVKLRQGIPGGPTPHQTMKDFNPPWEDIPYDSDTTKPKSNGEIEDAIYNYGCKLTALSMLLNSAGVQTLPVAKSSAFVLNDPGSLNAWMLAENLYDNEGVHGVPVVASVAAASGKANLTFKVPQQKDSTIDPSGAASVLDNALRGIDTPDGLGHAVLVGVDDGCVAEKQAFPCHYVVVWGKRANEFLIADPKPTNPASCLQNGTCASNGIVSAGTALALPTYTHLKLSDYDHYLTGGYVSDPANLAGLTISSANNVNLTLESSSGSNTGFDPATQGVVNDIPSSGYFVESLQNNEDATLSTPTLHSIEASDFTEGQYQLTVTGESAGMYTARIFLVSEDGTLQPSSNLSGVAGTGSASTFNIVLSTSPGSTPIVTRSATATSTAADVSNGLKSGLIKNTRLATLLSSLVRDAGVAQAKGKCLADRVILEAFIVVVRLFTGKGIDPTLSRVLVEDAEFLIGSCKP